MKELVIYKKKAACNLLTSTSAQSYIEEIQKVNNTEKNGLQLSQVIKDQPTITSSVSFQMLTFSPIMNSNGTGIINFVVNICPTGNISMKNSTEVRIMNLIYCLKELMWMTYSVIFCYT